jgi:hypothetical protein
MKVLKRNKGQLVIYLLATAAIIALVLGVMLLNPMRELESQIRLGLVEELTGECDGNMAQCRIAAANLKIYHKAGDKYNKPLRIRSKALKRFIRVMPARFKFSSQANLKWQGFMARLNKYGLINAEENFVNAAPGDNREIYDIYYGLKLLLVKSQANNYTFDF